MGAICHACSVQAIFKLQQCTLQHVSVHYCNSSFNSLLQVFVVSHRILVDTVFLSYIPIAKSHRA